MSERGRSRLKAWRPVAPGVTGAELTRRAGHWRDQARSTPGRLALIGLVLILLVLGAGAATGLAITDRGARIDTVRESTVPLADAAQDLYASLSIADATASTAFLAGGLQPEPMVDRYDSAIATAAAALSTAAVGAAPTDTAARELVASMSDRLPVYTGLIATANANNRTGNPVGVNYLGEASDLMQQRILPQAQKLYAEQSAALLDAQKRNSRAEWVPLAVIGVALAVLVAFQVYLARRSRRVLNFGLAVATVALGGMFVWTLVSSLVAANYSHRAYTEATRPLGRLTTARITAQQARTDETRSLLVRGDDSDLTDSFARSIATVATVLTPEARSGNGNGTIINRMDDAREHLDAWQRAHGEMRWDLVTGDYTEAVGVAIGPEDASAATQFAAFDDDLAARIDAVRSHGEELTQGSSDSTRLLVPGAAALSLLAAAGIVAGLRPRLSEYQ